MDDDSAGSRSQSQMLLDPTELMRLALEEACNPNPGSSFVNHGGVGKPQVWVRLRPSPRFDDNIFEIGEDGTTLRLLVDPKEDRLLQRMMKDDVIKQHSRLRTLTFKVDGILRNSSQEDTYSTTVDEIVNKAMAGLSGIVITIGPEVSGKSFTLFGYPKKYEYRGVIPRALEKMFQIIEAKGEEVKYKVQIAIIEIRQNRIKDLLTMGTSELLRINKNGPQGMYYKVVNSVEQGLGLVMLALSGQRGIPREEFAKYHTIVYIDIHGETLNEVPEVFDSRLTFSKIASMPKRSSATETDAKKCCGAQPRVSSKHFDSCPNKLSENEKGSKVRTKAEKILLLSQPTFEKSRSCCLVKRGPVGEAIEIRRDLYLLEQMFIRSNELRKLKRFYVKVERMGMLMLIKPPNPAPSQYFRQCKLAHCLQDIVSGTSEIRIILTIRPEKQFLHSTLEAMRFAQKVKCVPIDIQFNSKKEPSFIDRNPNPMKLKEELLILREEEQIQDRLANSPAGLSDLQVRRQKPSMNRQRIYEATDYLEGRIEQIKIVNKDQVKMMFETMRQMWKFAAEHEWRKKQQQQKNLDDGLALAEKAGKEESTRQAKKKVKPLTAFGGKFKKKSKRGATNVITDAGETTLQSEDKKKPDSPSVETATGSASRGIRFSIDGIAQEGAIGAGSSKLINEDNLTSDLNLDGEVEQDEDENNEAETGLEIPHLEIPEIDFKPSVDVIQEQEVKLDIPDIYSLMAETETEPKSKVSAWIAFVKTIPGLTKFEELSFQNNLLNEQCAMHTEIALKVRSVLSNLTQLLRAFNRVLEENAKPACAGDCEAFGPSAATGVAPAENATILVPTDKELMADIKALEFGRDELVDKMNIVRAQAMELMTIVSNRKQECEEEFQKFCLDRFAITFEKGDQIIPVPFSDEFPPGNTTMERQEEIVKHYENIRRGANKQAKHLLRLLYSSRPSWYPY